MSRAWVAETFGAIAKDHNLALGVGACITDEANPEHGTEDFVYFDRDGRMAGWHRKFALPSYDDVRTKGAGRLTPGQIWKDRVTPIELPSLRLRVGTIFCWEVFSLTLVPAYTLAQVNLIAHPIKFAPRGWLTFDANADTKAEGYAKRITGFAQEAKSQEWIERLKMLGRHEALCPIAISCNTWNIGPKYMALTGHVDEVRKTTDLIDIPSVPDAERIFLEAEGMQAQYEREYPLLYSLRGFQYCDLLLNEPERAAWRAFGKAGYPPPAAARLDEDISPYLQRCGEVEQRTAEILKWTEGLPLVNLLDSGLDHLTLARAALYRIILQGSETREAKSEIAQALDRLRRSGYAEQLPRGFLTRAWLRVLEGDAAGARADLDEACQIAERGPMQLHMADIHLHRARLFHGKEDLQKAGALIERCGYWRRKEELEDAQVAARVW